MAEVCVQPPTDLRSGRAWRKDRSLHLKQARSRPSFTPVAPPSQYQNPVENAYWLLPRPPQPQAAHFKRLYRN
jgi:hypothetical protein